MSAVAATLTTSLACAFAIWVSLVALTGVFAESWDGGSADSPAVVAAVIIALAALVMTPASMVVSLEVIAGVRVRGRRVLAIAAAAAAAGAVPLFLPSAQEEFPPLAPWLAFGLASVLALTFPPFSPRAALALRAALAAVLAALTIGLLDYRIATLTSVVVPVPLAAAELAMSYLALLVARRR